MRRQIQEIFETNKSQYDYRRIHAVLRQAGFTVNHKTTQKLMREMRFQGKQKRNKYRSYKGSVGKVAPNILDRQFKAHKPFEKLVTDVTEFAVCDEKVYLSPILDLFNSEVVSYSISRNPNFVQTKNMMAGLFFKLPPDAAPIMHSDQGWQYQMRKFQKMLSEHNITQSMSRKGNCLDNSVMENFFDRLKTEMFFGEHFESVEEFEKKLSEYICYFNNDRISLKLKGMSPVQYRTHSSLP
ncbi:IS3 family transposase [Victivallis sp. Marseille-Q1083]|uniref:IS3 family transposase n=1 Tax=Victivallis sp. Marseille-Q1083 TaxID=2717288 RepID=UPI00158A8289